MNIHSVEEGSLWESFKHCAHKNVSLEECSIKCEIVVTTVNRLEVNAIFFAFNPRTPEMALIFPMM